MERRINRKKCNEFIRRYNAGATVTVETVWMNRFNIKDGWTLAIKGHTLYVYDPDGDLFETYDLYTTKLYIKD